MASLAASRAILMRQRENKAVQGKENQVVRKSSQIAHGCSMADFRFKEETFKPQIVMHLYFRNLSIVFMENCFRDIEIYTPQNEKYTQKNKGVMCSGTDLYLVNSQGISVSE